MQLENKEFFCRTILAFFRREMRHSVMFESLQIYRSKYLLSIVNLIGRKQEMKSGRIKLNNTEGYRNFSKILSDITD